ncbi:carbon-nitrogen hydrolase [Tuber brumale]|nr:carbon-nitrogen hydrolase [Tuber brumale]
MSRWSPILSHKRAITLIRVVVEHPLGVEDEQYFLANYSGYKVPSPHHPTPYQTHRQLTQPSISTIPLAAIAQFTSTNIPPQNLKICQNFIRTAASKGAVALFLPEASNCISGSVEESHSLYQPVDTSPFALGLREEAKKCTPPANISIHEPTGDGLKERKVHVFDVDIEGGPRILESRSAEPGTALTPPFDTPIGKLDLLICFDFRFPEVSLALRRQGASILTYNTFSRSRSADPPPPPMHARAPRRVTATPKTGPIRTFSPNTDLSPFYALTRSRVAV